MTPKFTASAYVRCDNKERRFTLIGKLNNIGYYYDLPLNGYDEESEIVHISNGLLYAEHEHHFCLTEQFENAIDCGIDTDLFLELAQMRSDIDKGQWFIWDDGDITKCVENTEIEMWGENGTNGLFRRRATPMEVYKYLKIK